MPYIVRLAPEGWPPKQEEQDIGEVEDFTEVYSKDVKGSAKRSAWAHLINKVYGINLSDRDTHGRIECRWNQRW